MKDESCKSPDVNKKDDKETSQLFGDKSYLNYAKLMFTYFFSQG